MKSRNTWVTPSSSPTLAGLTWSETYSHYEAKLGGWLKLSFNYTTDGYVLFVDGRKQNKRAKSPEEAAQILLASAKLYLDSALAEWEACEATRSLALQKEGQ